ncbi:hypothetical protein CBM2626_U40021 [Cupriavidus taiwanensis]|nr:hypothetical protein CBM2614_U40021 [Cupriavidus taiwanensis]SOZ73894.1 hypothetical protein CBM2615_U30019 [Cupriavidus taiwanensis]SOZ75350.1 hypothetical protein CBM2613_U30019 [Cupriavidus taiwanensis]SPA03883.1 hypothetical protein CBM2626_U40021 [Cupriavidus taiwanensis]SPA57681.1 hypothetical protein CBM2638_U20015 [Cupriavidus taiwanensis]
MLRDCATPVAGLTAPPFAIWKRDRAACDKQGYEVWACNALYAAAHFDFAPVAGACGSEAD